MSILGNKTEEYDVFRVHYVAIEVVIIKERIKGLTKGDSFSNVSVKYLINIIFYMKWQLESKSAFKRNYVSAIPASSSRLSQAFVCFTIAFVSPL